MTDTTDVLEMVGRWAAAEQGNDAQVRDYGAAAVVVAVLAQETSYRGGDNSGRFRLTLVAVRPADRWLLAGAHIGMLQQPPGPAS
jgi:ketosteroid isomerase-like protein